WYEVGEDRGKPDWKKHVVDDESLNPCHGHPVDMDKDGDIDIVMALGYFSDQELTETTNQVAWYENVGTPGTGRKWKKHIIGQLKSAFESVAVDLDGDGDLDVVATAMGSTGGVFWFESPGDPG